MAKRIILAGILGGIAMFAWMFIAHEVLPLGEVGVKAVPNEGVVRARLKENIAQPGLYLFPAPDMSPGQTREQQQAAMQKMVDKYRAGPNGFLVIHPEGQEFSFPKLLLVQLGTDVFSALLAAWLLAQASSLTGLVGRVAFVTLLGVLPTLVVDLPYWNWYSFPTNYTLAQFATQVIGFFVAGLILAGLVKPKS